MQEGDIKNAGSPSINRVRKYATASRLGVNAFVLTELGFNPFARYFGMSAGTFEVEFGFPVESGVEGGGRVVTGSTPEGKAASSLYIGPYGEIEGVYDALMKWVEDNGFALSGEAYEVYLDNPAETPPDQLRTRVYLMLAEG